jgi:hypothetical protein
MNPNNDRPELSGYVPGYVVGLLVGIDLAVLGLLVLVAFGGPTTLPRIVAAGLLVLAVIVGAASLVARVSRETPPLPGRRR